MSLRKRYLTFLVLTIALIVLCSTAVYADTLDSIYEEVKVKYPGDIQKMQDNGASEDDIRNFINALEVKINAGEDTSSAIFSMFFDSRYQKVFDAVMSGWNLSADTLVAAYLNEGNSGVYNLLPTSLQQIGSMVKDRLAQTVSGGSITSGSIKNDSSNNLVQSSVIQEQLGGTSTKIEVNINEQNSMLEIKADDLNKIFQANKSLVVKSSEGDVTFTILPGTLEVDGDNNIQFNISKLPDAEVQGLMKEIAKDTTLASDIFELDIERNSSSNSKVTLIKPVQVALAYKSTGLSDDAEDYLAIFRYNESTEQWDLVGGRVNKIDKTVEWDANHFSKYAVMMINKKTFSDIQSHWAQKDIEFLASKGIFKGIVNGNIYDPERPVNRAEFATMLVNLLGISTENVKGSAFNDVEIWYENAVNAAYSAGLVAGVGSNKFEPTRTITRQEIMAIITRALSYKGMDIQIDENTIDDILAKYSDSSLVSPWAKKVAVIAINQGIISGRTNTTIAPLENTTRAEAAVIINRLYQKIN